MLTQPNHLKTFDERIHLNTNRIFDDSKELLFTCLDVIIALCL